MSSGEQKLVLVLGATGKTGAPLTKQLLESGYNCRIIVRSAERVPESLRSHPRLKVTEANVLELSDEQLAEHSKNCAAIVSCLGHTMDLKGLYGHPQKLCTDAVRRMYAAIVATNPSNPVKLILMGTVGVPYPGVDQKRGWVDRAVLFLLRHLLPPHRDNETAAQYLLSTKSTGSARSNDAVEWCIVRPDSLIDDDEKISQYTVAASPSTGIFNGKPTTRANVAAFMKSLIEIENLWDQWKFEMPTIVNADSSS
eukprot:m.42071 g.42071  ORF g.42071 m.42071 type:complete len:254 (-) comp14998_c0_seq1:96-857(-)